MRLENSPVLVTLVILLMIFPVISACGNDDESPAPVVTPTPTTIPTTIQTSPVEPAVTPTEPPTPQEDIDVTIGVFSDITGMAASAMSVIDVAIEDLVTYFNSENLIPGANLKVITYDTQYNPSNDIPGYEWLKERGADVMLTGLPNTPITVRPRLEEDGMLLFSMNTSEDMIDPPGNIFCCNAPTPSFAYTLMKYIADLDWDYETKGPAKIGAAGWAESYAITLFDAMEQYCDAHPDQFEWEGGYLTSNSITWSTEVDAIFDCDYIMIPATAFGPGTFIKEYRQSGGTAKFLGTDAHLAFLHMIKASVDWNDFDGMLIISPYTWWNEDSETTRLARQLLEEHHSTGEIDRYLNWSGGAYIGTYAPVYTFLSVLAKAINDAGPGNFSSESLYDTATSFSITFDGYEELNFSNTKRTSWNYLAIREASAVDQDIVRKDPAYYPVIYEP
ncbi:MAG: ABC transporter substrate-binding protein [Chloroflexi bacterium]|nr:ABC transporter substrate-binding protein [Chloroflexota bacterium]